MRVWIALPTLLCAGCLSLSWTRASSAFPPAPAAVAQISIGESTLTECLERLGAPLLVEEYGPGMALYWGWTRQSGWGLRVTVPITDSRSASVSYDDVDLDLEALLITFDAERRVEMMQYGRLADLVGIVARRRPQLVDDTPAQQ